MAALFLAEPSGTYFAWKATATGKNSMSVTDFPEKKYTEDMDDNTTVRLAIIARRRAEGWHSLDDRERR